MERMITPAGEHKNSGMSRREFLRDTGMAVGAFALGSAGFFASCSPSVTSPVTHRETTAPADSPSDFGRGFYIGVLPTPGEGQSFEEAYRQASAFAGFVPVWGRPTPFYDMPDELAGPWGQTFIAQYTRGNGMFPLVHMSFIGDNMTLVSPLGTSAATLGNSQWRELYKRSAIDIVTTARPLYLSLGNEVNRWYEQHGNNAENPDGFQNYVSLYEEVYDAVKSASPRTQVFCTFAREIVSENREADTGVLKLFNPAKMDLLVLTSYPHAVRSVNSPPDIPDDYYSRLLEFMPGKALGFSEAAWPSLDAFGGEQGQADFLNELCGRLTRNRGVNLKLLGWPWLHDLSADDYTGLITNNGATKLAYDIWKSLSITGEYRTLEQAVPAAAVKITPETDIYAPILHSDEYEQPVPMPYPINTRAAEDSGFMMPDENTFYSWATRIPAYPLNNRYRTG